VFVAFLSYCLYVTLGRQLKSLAPGLTARSAPDKFAAVQMVDVRIPTTTRVRSCSPDTHKPEPEFELLLEHLRLSLPAQLAAERPKRQSRMNTKLLAQPALNFIETRREFNAAILLRGEIAQALVLLRRRIPRSSISPFVRCHRRGLSSL
jgi:hypothetical protein